MARAVGSSPSHHFPSRRGLGRLAGAQRFHYLPTGPTRQIVTLRPGVSLFVLKEGPPLDLTVTQEDPLSYQAAAGPVTNLPSTYPDSALAHNGSVFYATQFYQWLGQLTPDYQHLSFNLSTSSLLRPHAGLRSDLLWTYDSSRESVLLLSGTLGLYLSRLRDLPLPLKHAWPYPIDCMNWGPDGNLYVANATATALLVVDPDALKRPCWTPGSTARSASRCCTRPQRAN